MIPNNKVSTSFKKNEACPQGITQWKRMNTPHKYRNYTPQDPSPMCSIQFTLPHELEPPVFLYYRLTNFYQNHRRYVKSQDTNQLKGDAVSAKTIESSNCDPLRNNNDKGRADSGKPFYPCGLIANSLFNDSFSNPLLLNVNRGNAMNQTYNMTNKGIAWDSDKALYGQTKYKPTDIAVPKNWRKQYPDEGYSDENPPPNLEEDEEFQVWMRTAGLPAFSKLAMRNDKEKMACGTYQLDIIDSMLSQDSHRFAANRYKISMSPSTAARNRSSFPLGRSWGGRILFWASPTSSWGGFASSLGHCLRLLI